MSIDITIRHTDALADVQEMAEREAAALMQNFPSIEHVHVIMDVERRRRHIAEVIVQGKNKIRFEAKESSDNMRLSLTAAMEKVAKHLGKVREKVHDHKAAMKHRQAVLKRRTEAAQ